MRLLTEMETQKIRGGFSIWTGLGIAAIVVFIVGIIDGYINPKECEVKVSEGVK